MKRIFNTILALTLVASFQSCGPTHDDAVNYNDSIIHEYNSVIDADNNLMDAWDKEPADMDAARKALVNRIDSALAEIKKIDKFDGSTVFADEAVKYLNFHRAIAETEYKEMVAINSKAPEDVTDEDDHRYTELSDITMKKKEEGETKFLDFQQEFAKKYKFEFKSDSTDTN